MGEAPLVETAGGLEPAGPGWFVVNARDTAWWTSEAFGASCPFEGMGEADERRRKTNDADARFPDVGINLHVLEPGKPNCMYHGEDAQEDFLVLHGECVLLVDGQERPLRGWDFVHCPAWVEHVFVGAGDGPCVLLMVGARRAGEGVLYPVSEVALGHGAGVSEETPEPSVAYARFPQWQRARVDDPRLPWSKA
jgi:uncharacterized cupin superfamily protein